MMIPLENNLDLEFLSLIIMNIEMVLVGMILFAGIAAAGLKIWITRRSEEQEDSTKSNSHF